MMERFYIAGPFFNPQQVAVIQMIEDALDQNGFPYFSPRKQHRGDRSLPPPKIDSPERAKEVYDMNVWEMRHAGAIIFVLDWLLPPMHELRVMESVQIGTIQDEKLYEMHVRSPALNIPDTGTVFELGFCAALGKKMALLKMTDVGKLNVMLAVPTMGVMYGKSGVERFLHMTPARKDRGLANWEILEQWKGGLV